MKDIVIGIDVGGTKIEASLYEKNQSNLFLISSERIPSEREKGYEEILLKIVSLINKIVTENSFNITDLKSIGVGLPGTINPKTKRMINGNTGLFIEKDFISDLKKSFPLDIPVFVANDANCFALAEGTLGAAKSLATKINLSTNDMITLGVILGTGCGGGLIISEKIFNGSNGSAAEVGHFILYENGIDCFCGQKGCAEQYLSGPAFEKSYSLRAKISKPAKEIFQLAQEGDVISLSVIKEYKEHMLKFLRNLSAIYDPHLIVFGGGLSNQNIIFEGLEKELKNINFAKGTGPYLRVNELGDSSGVLGAALLTNS